MQLSLEEQDKEESHTGINEEPGINRLDMTPWLYPNCLQMVRASVVVNP
jgi:hypothetical protein